MPDGRELAVNGGLDLRQFRWRGEAGTVRKGRAGALFRVDRITADLVGL